MKKSIKALSTLLAVTILTLIVSACTMEWQPIGSSDSGSSSTGSVPSPDHPASISSFADSSVNSEDNTTNSQYSASSFENAIPLIDTEQLTEYALTLAKYFREPISSSNELTENPHLFEFTINTLYDIYQTNNIVLENTSGKDWYLEFHIPNQDLTKAANLLLTANLPDIVYTNEDFQYLSEQDAFIYSPWSPPMFSTSLITLTEDSNTLWHVDVQISDVEGNNQLTNTYTFKPIEDKEWGILYQLIDIKPYAN